MPPPPPRSTLFPYTTLFRSLPVYVIGVGSNLIVRDGGVPGVVIRLAPRAFGEVKADGDIVTAGTAADRKSTRLNSSHGYISYAVFCLKKKKKKKMNRNERST